MVTNAFEVDWGEGQVRFSVESEALSTYLHRKHGPDASADLQAKYGSQFA